MRADICRNTSGTDPGRAKRESDSLNSLSVDGRNALFSQEKMWGRRTYIVGILEKNTSFHLLEKMG